MARIRTIKPEFWVNEQLADLAPLTRLLALGLLNYADREGRMEDRPARIKVTLLPYDGACDVDAMLNELGSIGYLLRYEASGCRYIQIVNFLKHQRPSPRELPSEIPPPAGVEWPQPLGLRKEKELEDFIAAALVDPASNPLDREIQQATRQKRVGDSYLDIFVDCDRPVVIELKRDSLSDAAIDQVERYMAMVPGSEGVLIGTGFPKWFDLDRCRTSSIGVLTHTLLQSWQLHNRGPLHPEVTGRLTGFYRQTNIDHPPFPSPSPSPSRSLPDPDLSAGSGIEQDRPEPRARREAKVKCSWPFGDDQPSPEMYADAIRIAGEIRIELDPIAEFAAWHDDCLAHGRQYLDWPGAWRSRIRLIPKYGSPTRASPTNGLTGGKARLFQEIQEDEKREHDADRSQESATQNSGDLAPATDRRGDGGGMERMPDTRHPVGGT